VVALALGMKNTSTSAADSLDTLADNIEQTNLL